MTRLHTAQTPVLDNACHGTFWQARSTCDSSRSASWYQQAGGPKAPRFAVHGSLTVAHMQQPSLPASKEAQNASICAVSTLLLRFTGNGLRKRVQNDQNSSSIRAISERLTFSVRRG